MSPELKLVFLPCMLQVEVLRKSVLKIHHVVDAATKIITFIGMRALNHRQFVALLSHYWQSASCQQLLDFYSTRSTSTREQTLITYPETLKFNKYRYRSSLTCPSHFHHRH